MVKEGREVQLMRLFERAIDPYGFGLVLMETEDGFITNEHWAVKKELMEPLQCQQYVRGVAPFKVHAILEEIFKKNEEKEVERNVAVYDNFLYYAVREEVVNHRRLAFYVLDIPVLFRKVVMLKNYADFIDAMIGGMQGNEVKRKLYYVGMLKKDGDEEVRPYFVWYGKGDDVVAICMGRLCSD